MKKTIPALLLIAAMLLTLCACSGAPAQNAAPEAAKTEAQETAAKAPAAQETAGEAAADPETAGEAAAPTPEPEKLYRMEERELLAQKRVFGRAASARDIPTAGPLTPSRTMSTTSTASWSPRPRPASIGLCGSASPRIPTAGTATTTAMLGVRN